MRPVTVETDGTRPQAGAPSPELAFRPLRMTAAGLTDTGRVRTRNEDSFLVAELKRALDVVGSSVAQPETLFSEARAHLLVVADGMGGHQGGDEASRLAVVTVEEVLLNASPSLFPLPGEDVPGELKEALRAADARLFEVAAQRPELEGMGTTITAAYVVGSTMYVVHAGDSRAYLYRQGVLEQVTRDHTLVGELVRHGVLSAEEARLHAMRNIVTNAAGGRERGLEAETHRRRLEPGDVVLLCTDGLTEMLPDPDIARLLDDGREPERVCQRLLAAANARGGRDNVTCVVARFDDARPN